MAVQLPDADDQAFAASIAERVRLGCTLGVEMVATVTHRRRARAAGTVVISGKLFELKALAGQVLRAEDRKSTRLNSSHRLLSRMPSSA